MKILILSRTIVGSRMASPGIRAYHMARVLAEALPHAEVTLAVPTESDLAQEALPFRIRTYDAQSAVSLVRETDILIAGALPPYLLPFAVNKTVVMDFYSPYYTEWLSLSASRQDMGLRRSWMETNRRYLLMQLGAADLILCANERQRDLYVGMLASLGLLAPDVYDRDPMLEHLFGIVPYGVRPGNPESTRRVLKGVHPGIEEDDKVLIWNGTIIEWYDIDTLLEAMGLLQDERPDIKLFFLGTEYPDITTSEPTEGLGGGLVRQAVDRCREEGLLDRTVFFNFDWCSYEETANYLLEADAGVCTGYDTLESRYAFRTRYVDLFWAGVPIVCTEGDVLADRVASAPLGTAVPHEDPAALANALRRVVDDEPFIAQCKENLLSVREEYRWERVLRPLVGFCDEALSERYHTARPLRLLGSSVSYATARLTQSIRTLITRDI